MMMTDVKPVRSDDDIFTEFEHAAFEKRQTDSVEVTSSEAEFDAKPEVEIESASVSDESGLMFSPRVEPMASETAVQPSTGEAAESVFSLRDLLFGSETTRRAAALSRIDRLDRAIALYPDAPSNYVLRAELYLKLGEYALAADDFRRALEVAQAQTQTDEWGLIAQSLQDRAQYGLARSLDLLERSDLSANHVD